MTKYVLITLCLFCSFLGFSQEKDSVISETVDFIIIENPPIFPGCEKLDNKLQKMCLQNQIQKHIGNNFNTGLANSLNLEPGKTKLIVVFEIASDGNVKNVKATGKHKKLEEEGLRVINSLPKMTPGFHEGNAVGVKFTLPITLMVDKKMEGKISDKINHAYISDKIQNIIEKDKTSFINETNYEIIKKLGYKTKDKVIVYTAFSIDKDGYIKDIKTRGPHKIFENEAMRILNQLSKTILTGTNRAGVSNKFTMPITITIEKPEKEKKRQKN